MTDTDPLDTKTVDKLSNDELFAEIRRGLYKLREVEKQTLDDLAGQVFDVYRAALGDDFTTQGVIRATTFGADIKQWDALDSHTRDVLGALGTQLPEKVDKEKLAVPLAEAVVEHLRSKGVALSDEQKDIFPGMMKDIMQVLETKAGVRFDNGVKKARILGIKQLIDYQNWLVNGGQFFMDAGTYELELTRIDTGIKANGNALATALVAARDIMVNSGLDQEIIRDIVQAQVKVNYSRNSPFVITYTTKEGKQGEIDAENASLKSLQIETVEHRIYELFYNHNINAEHNQENLEYDGSIEALVGLPGTIEEELRANAWKRQLKHLGVDFSQPAEVVYVDLSVREKVTFYYSTKNHAGEDNGIMVALTFDERYGNRYAWVCTREVMKEEIQRAQSMKEQLDPEYMPLLDPLAVRTYVEKRQRLTEHRP